MNFHGQHDGESNNRLSAPAGANCRWKALMVLVAMRGRGRGDQPCCSTNELVMATSSKK